MFYISADRCSTPCSELFVQLLNNGCVLVYLYVVEKHTCMAATTSSETSRPKPRREARQDVVQNTYSLFSSAVVPFTSDFICSLGFCRLVLDVGIMLETNTPTSYATQ